MENTTATATATVNPIAAQTAPAENKFSYEIQSLNRCAADFTERKQKLYHDEWYPTAMAAIAKYGADQIFQYIEDYHGKYEDDYCSFLYFNNVTGEFFSDSWTTAAACPAFSLYECLRIDQAIEAGLLTNPAFMEKMKDSFRAECMTLLNQYNQSHNNPMVGRRVACNRGRKWKGEGILLKVVKKTFYSYYGKGHVSETALILDDDHTIQECNWDMCNYADTEQFTKEYEKFLDNYLREVTYNTIAPHFNSGHRNLGKAHPWNFYEGSNYSKLPDCTFADWPAETERKNKLREKREQKRQELVAWASKFTDKTEEERAFMVERALKKQIGEIYSAI